MTFLDAYARFWPDTIAIGEALDIPEHEADMLINAKMDRDRLGPKPAVTKGKIRYAGYDRKEALGVNGGRYD